MIHEDPFFPFSHPSIPEYCASDGDGSRKEVLTVLVLSLVKLVDVGLHGFMLGILLYCTYLSAVYCQQAQLQVRRSLDEILYQRKTLSICP